MYETLAVLAAFTFVYSIVASRLERTPVNGPVVFLAFGLVVGPDVLGLIDPSVHGGGLRLVAELTLALVLFTDSANADLATLRRSFKIPQRLLMIGLPITIAFGFGLGKLLFPELPVLTLAILATMLAPTDAALGQAVVTNPAVPAPIREGLNVESGLNDGICVPILFTFLALAAGTDGSIGEIALRSIAEEIGIGLVVGVGLSVAGRYGGAITSRRGWVDEPWTQIPVLALALTCFAAAQAAGGSGFIACFTGGLVFGGLVEQNKQVLLSGAEGGGKLLSILTWVMFGAAVVGRYVGDMDWEIVLYSLLSLTVVRMLPVSLSLLGLGIRWDAQLFLGWFGPRGLASIVFAVIVVDQNVAGSSILATTVVCTVALSILAHGLTANPFAAAFSARAKTDPSLQA
jgi:NhaP-type Na+/H+ or K+/H+ antiporter